MAFAETLEDAQGRIEGGLCAMAERKIIEARLIPWEVVPVLDFLVRTSATNNKKAEIDKSRCGRRGIVEASDLLSELT